jgi:hypothetical protein
LYPKMEAVCPPKRRLGSARLYGATSHRSVLYIVTAMETAGPAGIFPFRFYILDFLKDFLSCLNYVVSYDTVACRPVARQQPRNKQLSNGP